jgi:hypothetical protein
MPYAPGVQDISGQLRAQGIAQAGQAWGQAIGNIGQSLNDAFNSYKQNQTLTNTALSKFAGATRANPEILKFLESGGEDQDPNAPKVAMSNELSKSYTDMKNGKITPQGAAMLATFADAYLGEKQKNVQMQHIALQNELLSGQVSMQQADINWMKNRAAAPTSVQPQAPAGITQFAGPSAGTPAATGAPSAQPTSGMGLRSEAGFDFKAPWSPANPAGVVDPAQVEAEVKASLPPSKQNTPDVVKKVQDIIDRRVKERERLMQAKEVMPSAQPRPIEGGKYLQTFDTRTGAPIGDPIPNINHPEIQKELERNKLLAKSTQDMADKDRVAGEAARKSSVALARLSNLLESGQLETGVGSEFVLNAMGAAKALGLPVNEEKLSAGNEGIAYFGQLLLPIYETQKGTVSNSEQALYRSMTGSMLKDSNANAALIKVISERGSVDQALERNSNLRQAGRINDQQFHDNREKILNEFDNRVQELAKIGGIDLTKSPKASVPAPAAGGAAPSGGQSQYITGATYKNKRNEEFIWDGTKMVPKK